MKIGRFFELAKKSVVAWSDDYAPSMGAAIAYYTVFSLAPLLLIVIAVAGLVFGREAVQGEIVAQLSGLIGKDGAAAVQSLIKSASEPAQGIIAASISVVVLVIGATTVFAELQSALDRIWRTPAEPFSGIWGMIRARLLSFGLIIALAFLLMVSLVVSAGLAAFGRWAGDLMPGWEITLLLLNIAISVGIMTVLFAMIYKFMPKARIGWHDVWIGASVTAVLFEVGKWLISLYVGKTSVVSSLAAAGSIIVLLVWVYYSAQIFLLGAEFTWVFATEHGSLSKGAPGAIAAPKGGTGIPKKAEDGSLTTAAPEAVPGSAPGAPQPSLPARPMLYEVAHGSPQTDRAIAESLPTPTIRDKVIVYGGLALLQVIVGVLLKRKRTANQRAAQAAPRRTERLPRRGTVR